MADTVLQEASEIFAEKLNGLIKATIHTDVRFKVTDTDNPERTILKATASDRGLRFEGLPLVRAGDDPEAPALPQLFTRIRASFV